MSFIKQSIKKTIPGFILHALYKSGIYKNYNPPPGKARTGDFLRKKPFSVQDGYDRGGPVDRYYIDEFLKKESASIKGRVLEIGDNNYTIQYGGSKVTQSDILHLNESNKQATFIGDLSTAVHIPDNSFDTIILTQTLQYIYKHADALENCRRILKPGGTLLITVPGISHISHDEWVEYWLWSFTKASMTKLLKESFPAQNFEVNSHGNVYVAAAFLYGMGLPEVRKENMDFHDPHYQVLITAKAVKPS
jgi:SAM-dependent methyltransferase